MLHQIEFLLLENGKKKLLQRVNYLLSCFQMKGPEELKQYLSYSRSIVLDTHKDILRGKIILVWHSFQLFFGIKQ